MPCSKVSIMEVERFSIHDGPGIRSTVFLQGCPLRCPWCANPESQVIGTHLMYQEQKCVRCQSCVKSCPAGAISFYDQEIHFDRERCKHCQTCGSVCLNNAIKFIGTVTNTEDVYQILKKDEAYYLESNGGVTFSGGEPFVQFTALKELLRMCHGQYHTAVETTGDTSWSNIEEVLPLIDLFLFDVKHYDPYWISKITMGNGKRIQDNFRKLAGICAHKIIARIPVIPGYNNEQEVIKGIFKFIADSGVKRADILPYHTLGVDKYRQLGRSYELLSAKMLNKSELKFYEQIGKDYGLDVHV